MRSVMVTSALPSEGKTLTATNLALTLEPVVSAARAADRRRPAPAAHARDVCPAVERRADRQPDDAGSDRLPVQQITPTLWVLTAGRVVPDPMSLLVSPAMKQLLDEARDAFDWVVVDTPPIAILPDANLLVGDDRHRVAGGLGAIDAVPDGAARGAGDRHRAHSRRGAQPRGEDDRCRAITATTATTQYQPAPSPARVASGAWSRAVALRAHRGGPSVG